MNTNSPDNNGPATSLVLTAPPEELPEPSMGADSADGANDPVPPGQADLFPVVNQQAG